jgi:hypothetical protein
MEAPTDVVPSVEAPVAQADDTTMKAALTPPTSEDNDKRDERLSSELSDIDSDDGEDIEPDHYFEGGKIPVFKPVCLQLHRSLHARRVVARNPDFALKSGDGTTVLTSDCADNGPIPELQAIHRQD